MMKIVKAIVCVLLMTGGMSFGQSVQPAAAPSTQTESKQYKAVFVAREVEGNKVINSRQYETNLTLNESPHGTGSLRAKGRFPVSTNGKDMTSWQYMDAQVNIDFHNAQIQGNSVVMNITASITSIDASSQDSAGHFLSVVERDNSWNSQVKVTLGKPEIIFSSDDVASKRTMQLELTVTPMR